jgi:RimJ/RimL family protein N-acetyltransferase
MVRAGVQALASLRSGQDGPGQHVRTAKGSTMSAPAARPPTGAPLIGSTVRLDMSVPGDAAALFSALDHEEVYVAAYNGGRRPAAPDDVAGWVTAAVADGRAMYTVRLIADSPLGAAGTVVGTSSLGDAVLAHGRIHHGWTAYAPSVWRTTVNPECKLLMLGHAFDDCGFERVKIQTDAINTRSQAAIAKLGAVREGTLRHHQRRADGSWRDTVVFSILAAEWPAVRAGILARLVEWSCSIRPDRPERR